jgi:hypothetical protein
MSHPSLPTLAASQVSATSRTIEQHGAYPVPVFQGDRVNEIAAFHAGEWVGSIAANPDGSGLIAMDEIGRVLTTTRSIPASVRAALHVTETLGVQRTTLRQDGVKALAGSPVPAE